MPGGECGANASEIWFPRRELQATPSKQDHLLSLSARRGDTAAHVIRNICERCVPAWCLATYTKERANHIPTHKLLLNLYSTTAAAATLLQILFFNKKGGKEKGGYKSFLYATKSALIESELRQRGLALSVARLQLYSLLAQ